MVHTKAATSDPLMIASVAQPGVATGGLSSATAAAAAAALQLRSAAPSGFVLQGTVSHSDGGPSSHSHETGGSMPGAEHAPGQPDMLAAALPGAPGVDGAAAAPPPAPLPPRQPVDEMMGCYRCRFSTVCVRVYASVHARVRPCMRVCVGGGGLGW